MEIKYCERCGILLGEVNPAKKKNIAQIAKGKFHWSEKEQDEKY